MVIRTKVPTQGIFGRDAARSARPLRFVRSRIFGITTRSFGASSRLYHDPHQERLQILSEFNKIPYPRLNLNASTYSTDEFLRRYTYLEPDQSADESEVHLYGRIGKIRIAGSKLVFLDVQQGSSCVQILCSHNDFTTIATPEFKAAFRKLQRGDIIEAVGQPERTTSGQLSLRLLRLPRLLSPCLHTLPKTIHDGETRIRNRHVDMLVNARLSGIVQVRATILSHLRQFLNADGHVEVQTPILADGAGGAVARSFVTQATEFPERNVNLRIAPELWLKRLIVGGMDRIFEIGPSFRNEGLDQTHNPEFTTCEFYRSYTDLETLIRMTEGFLSGLAIRLRELQGELELGLTIPEIDFTGPYKRLDFITGIEERAKCKLPNLKSSDAATEVMQILTNNNISFNSAATLPQLLDRLAAHYLEPECIAPTWIINHPECMSPLSKSFLHPTSGQVVTARGELFVQAKEVVNTYEEENSPIEQRRKFEQQIAFREIDNETFVDESYLEALEWGMPPTGGWGCGIDRLCMLMTGAPRIADVLTFGNLRNVVSLRHAHSVERATKPMNEDKA